MYAVIETGGKQYKVELGSVINVEKLDVQPGQEVKLDKVLALSTDAGIQIGTPYVEGEAVTATVVENGKADKVIIFKYKNKKDYRKKQGHRQPYTQLQIVGMAGQTYEAPAAEVAEAPKAEVVAEETVAPVEEKKVSASMKKQELIDYAKANGIEVDEKATKAVIIDTINNAK